MTTDAGAEEPRPRRTRRVVVAGVTVAVVVLVVAVAAIRFVSADRADPTLVVLGDSYTAGSGITDVIGEPWTCFRSPDSYPMLVQRRLVEAGTDVEMHDASCAGARFSNLQSEQRTEDGVNPPQFDVLDDDARVVILGMGVNDIGFAAIGTFCLEHPEPGGCRHRFVDDGTDVLRERIGRVGTRLDTAITEIRRRAPDALVVVVGYPTILPADGNCADIGVATGDATYLSGAFDDLNATLQRTATAAGAVFVDTATSSTGHDVCAGDEAWITPPGTDVAKKRDGLILHPTATGAAHVATLVTDAIETHLTK